MKIIVVKKGYTLKVDSFAGDGEHCSTRAITVESRERAEILTKMCVELLRSYHDDIKGGIVNLTDDDYDEGAELIRKWVADNPTILETGWDNLIDVDCVEDYIHKLREVLVGNTEYLLSRVVETVEVIYSPENILAEKMPFSLDP